MSGSPSDCIPRFCLSPPRNAILVLFVLSIMNIFGAFLLVLLYGFQQVSTAKDFRLTHQQLLQSIRPSEALDFESANIPVYTVELAPEHNLPDSKKLSPSIWIVGKVNSETPSPPTEPAPYYSPVEGDTFTTAFENARSAVYSKEDNQRSVTLSHFNNLYPMGFPSPNFSPLPSWTPLPLPRASSLLQPPPRYTASNSAVSVKTVPPLNLFLTTTALPPTTTKPRAIAIGPPAIRPTAGSLLKLSPVRRVVGDTEDFEQTEELGDPNSKSLTSPEGGEEFIQGPPGESRGERIPGATEEDIHPPSTADIDPLAPEGQEFANAPPVSTPPDVNTFVDAPEVPLTVTVAPTTAGRNAFARAPVAQPTPNADAFLLAPPARSADAVTSPRSSGTGPTASKSIYSSKQTTRGLSKLTASSITPSYARNPIRDCSVESNQYSDRACTLWQRAGYCESHPVTKFLFCRLQCACIGPVTKLTS